MLEYMSRIRDLYLMSGARSLARALTGGTVLDITRFNLLAH